MSYYANGQTKPEFKLGMAILFHFFNIRLNGQYSNNITDMSIFAIRSNVIALICNDLRAAYELAP